MPKQHTKLRTSLGEVVWFPNSLMVTLPVANLTRSSDKWEAVRVLVDASAPLQASSFAVEPA